MIATLLALATLFGTLSLIAFGGGNAVIVSMQHQAVAHRWLTDRDFIALFALSRAAPGPGSLISALVGQRAAGLPGALVATLAMTLPSSALVALAANFWRRHERATWRFRIEGALIPVAIGLTLGSGLALAERDDHGALAWAITIASTAILAATRANPLLVLVLGGAAGVALL